MPIIGWCWHFTESIFIKRKWDADCKTLVRDFDNILKDYPDGYYFNVNSFK